MADEDEITGPDPGQPQIGPKQDDPADPPNAQPEPGSPQPGIGPKQDDPADPTIGQPQPDAE